AFSQARSTRPRSPRLRRPTRARRRPAGKPPGSRPGKRKVERWPSLAPSLARQLGRVRTIGTGPIPTEARRREDFAGVEGVLRIEGPPDLGHGFQIRF